MRGIFGFLGLLIVAASGFYIYSRQATALSPGGSAAASPRATIDLVGVRNDLIAIASAERRHQASDGRYASLDDLISNGDVSMQRKERGPYQYSSDASESSFRITATYSGDAPPGVPHSMSIDESMQIRQE